MTRVTSNVIKDGTIINADISPSAAIAASKIGDGQLPAGVTTLATGSTTVRSLANRFADVVNVKDFGATGVDNGTNDDAPAIRAAIAYAVANDKPVYFPSGIYPFKTDTLNRQFPITNTGGSIGIYIENFTTLTKNLYIFGDNAEINNYLYVARSRTTFPEINNSQFLQLQGYFKDVEIRNLTFNQIAPTTIDEPNIRWLIGINITTDLSQPNWYTTEFCPQNVVVDSCVFNNFSMPLTQSRCFRSQITNNKFLCDYGQLRVGNEGLRVALDARAIDNLLFTNNFYNGITKNSFNLPNANSSLKTGLDGSLFARDYCKQIICSNNIVKGSSFEAIAVSGTAINNPEVNLYESYPCVISNNTIDGEIPSGGSVLNTNLRGISCHSNGSVISSNVITNCNKGIVVSSQQIGLVAQGSYNSIVENNTIVLANASNPTANAPETGYGTIGIECASSNILVKNNKIIGINVPQGTLSGWDGGINITSGARPPSAFFVAGSAEKANNCCIEGNDVIIYSKFNPASIFVGIIANNESSGLISRNNKFNGCDYILTSVASPTNAGPVLSENDAFLNGKQYFVTSNRFLQTTFNRNQLWLYPTQTGWYKITLTGRYTGSCKFKITVPTLGFQFPAFNHTMATQTTEFVVSYTTENTGGDGFDTIASYSQIANSSLSNPIVTSVAIGTIYSGSYNAVFPIWIYVNRVAVDSNNKTIPIAILFENSNNSSLLNYNNSRTLALNDFSPVGIELDASVDVNTFFIRTSIGQGIKMLTRKIFGGQNEPIKGFSDPILGTGVPANNAEFAGQTYIDYTNSKVYVSNGVVGNPTTYPYIPLN